MAALTDQDGHVAQVSPEGRLQVESSGVASLPTGAATEAAVTANTAALESLHTTMQAFLRELETNQNPPYQRDINDRMRVVSDTTSTVLSYIYTSYFGSAGAYAAWYAQGLLGSLDPREALQWDQMAGFEQSRARWVFT